MEECQEPRCTHPAQKVWGGRKVCTDHYEQYKDQQDKWLNTMEDF